jgi:hypothetical protein
MNSVFWSERERPSCTIVKPAGIISSTTAAVAQ